MAVRLKERDNLSGQAVDRSSRQVTAVDVAVLGFRTYGVHGMFQHYLGPAAARTVDVSKRQTYSSGALQKSS